MTEPRPTEVEILARHVEPYYWALWCSVGGGEPFENLIVAKRPSEGGDHFSFMLDTHNFFNARPDEVLRLVPVQCDSACPTCKKPKVQMRDPYFDNHGPDVSDAD